MNTMNERIQQGLRYCKATENPYAKLGVFNEDELLAQGQSIDEPKESATAPVPDARTAARRMLMAVWKMEGRGTGNVLEFLKRAPRIAAEKILGVRLVFQPDFTLLQLTEGLNFTIAGFMDRGNNTIGVVNTHSRECQRFTLAHEIGHWVLHPHQLKFRDAPITAIDAVTPARDPSEREANAFAAELLMPRKTVRSEFDSIFGTQLSASRDAHIICEWAASSRISSPDPHQYASLDLNHQSSIVAQIVMINGRRLSSMAERFDVSPLAMGIRLKELGLVIK